MHKTLPTWMLELGEPIDAVRKLLRSRPDLQRLGVRHGPTAVYTAAEAQQIVEALRTWKAAVRHGGRSRSPDTTAV